MKGIRRLHGGTLSRLLKVCPRPEIRWSTEEAEPHKQPRKRSRLGVLSFIFLKLLLNLRKRKS